MFRTAQIGKFITTHGTRMFTQHFVHVKLKADHSDCCVNFVVILPRPTRLFARCHRIPGCDLHVQYEQIARFSVLVLSGFVLKSGAVSSAMTMS